MAGRSARLTDLPGLRALRNPSFRLICACVVLGGALLMHLLDAVAAVQNWASTAGTATPSDFDSLVQSAALILGGGSPYQPVGEISPVAFAAGAMHQPYPPTFFLLFAPWVLAPDWLRFGSWLLLEEAALAAVPLAVWAALGRPGRVEAVMCAAMVLPFLPVRQNLFEGQFNMITTALATIALLAWQRGRPGLGGVLLGVAVALKPTSLLVLPFFAYLRAWRLLVVALGAVAVCVAVTFATGWGHLWVPFLELSSLLGRGTAFVANQTVNGVVLRAWRPEFSGEPIPPIPIGVQALIYALDAVLVAVVVLGLRRVPLRGAERTWFEFAAMLVALTLVQPFGWFHHLVTAVVAITVAVRLAARGALGGVAVSLLVAAYAVVTVIAYPVHVAAREVGGPSLVNLPALRWATSMTFAAMTVAVIVLAWATRPQLSNGPSAATIDKL